jgi:hypothetical protein
VRPNEELDAGERYGMSKLGSQTDMLLSAGRPLDALVKPGDAQAQPVVSRAMRAPWKL